MNTTLLESYADVVDAPVISQIKQLGSKLEGKSVVHVNSTRSGGGVAEILNRFVPLMQGIGIDAQWEIIQGEEQFFEVTKSIHNALQGNSVEINDEQWSLFESVNRHAQGELGEILQNADFVFIHDPQPCPLLSLFPQRKGKWIWRCHIDVSRPHRKTWRTIKKYVNNYDASIFSLPDFARPLPHLQYLVPPSIDPLSDKNVDLPDNEVEQTIRSYGLDPHRPIVLQVSRFDRFKDPVGVIKAYRICKEHQDLQLVLAGGGATDDPEGDRVLQEVHQAAAEDPDVHILVLPPNAHKTINALQRGADVILQKSIREGFGLTVSEAMWKSRPVIGGDVGGIRLQVLDRFTGFRVQTPEGAALRLRYLLKHRHQAERIGKNGREYVRDNFLITQQLRNVLAIMVALQHETEAERLEVFV
ncbi:MAG: glycosyltransferase [Synergistales bacterium]|nr:glycosyltransferase [Synergistales bacterium]